MKVCDITTFYPSAGSGGVKQYILGKRHYCAKHPELHHASIVPGEFDHTELSTEGSPEYVIKSPGFFWNPSYKFLCSFKKVKAALLDFQPDLVETGDPYLLPWLVRRVYRNRTKPVIIGFYHSDFPRADVFRILRPLGKPIATLGQKFSEAYCRLVYNKLDGCIVHTEQFKTRLEEIGIHNVKVLPYGVDTQLFKPSSDVPENMDNKIRLLYVGRIAPDKMILELLESITTAHAKRPEIEFTVIGSGHFEKQLKIAMAGKSFCTLKPFIKDKRELAKEYQRHDLLVVANPYETFCRAALESIACGTPVAACSVNSGVEMFINEKTGFVVGTEVNDFVPFLTSLDLKALRAMSKEASGFAQHNFDVDESYARYFAYYEDLIAKAHKASSAA